MPGDVTAVWSARTLIARPRLGSAEAPIEAKTRTQSKAARQSRNSSRMVQFPGTAKKRGKSHRTAIVLPPPKLWAGRWERASRNEKRHDPPLNLLMMRQED